MTEIKKKQGPLVHCIVRGPSGSEVKFSSWIYDAETHEWTEYHHESIHLGNGQHLPLPSASDNNVHVNIPDGVGDWKTVWESLASDNPIEGGDTLEFLWESDGYVWELLHNGTLVASDPSQNAAKQGAADVAAASSSQ